MYVNRCQAESFFESHERVERSSGAAVGSYTVRGVQYAKTICTTIQFALYCVRQFWVSGIA